MTPAPCSSYSNYSILVHWPLSSPSVTTSSRHDLFQHGIRRHLIVPATLNNPNHHILRPVSFHTCTTHHRCFLDNPILHIRRLVFKNIKLAIILDLHHPPAICSSHYESSSATSPCYVSLLTPTLFSSYSHYSILGH